jgi:hypothetical protein
MINYLFHILVAIPLLFFLPGFSVISNLELKCAGFGDKLLLSVAVSLGLIPLFFVVLDWFGLINLLVVVLTFLAFSFAFLALCFYNGKGFFNWRALSKNTFLKRQSIVLLSLFFVVFAMASVNWSSALGVHSIDIGAHIFWSQEILNTGHLPVYTIIEPLDQSSRFTYGSHSVLAAFSLFSNSSLQEVFWIPSLLFSFLTLFAVILLARSLTNSYYPGLIAGFFYALAFLPGGYIQRGNISDIFGFFLVATCIFSVKFLDFRNHSPLMFSLLFGAVFIFHAYAGLVLAGVFLLAFLLRTVFSREKPWVMARHLQSQFGFWPYWFLLLLLLSSAFLKLPYLNLSSPLQLQSSNWTPYLIPVFEYPVRIGIVLFYIGIIGFVVVFSSRNSKMSLLLLSWFVVLLALANGPLFGLQVEPHRFFWRIVEPLSVFAAVGMFTFFGVLNKKASKMHNLRVFRLDLGHPWFNSKNFLSVFLILLFVLILFLQFFASFPFPDRYTVDEPYFEGNASFGRFLSENSSWDDVIAVDADVDNTATWIQAYAHRPHFLYKVDFATSVATIPYRLIYQDMSTLFKNPKSVEVGEIIGKYNLTYVVAHGNRTESFRASPFFSPVFSTAHGQIYMTQIPPFYGSVTSARGWLLTTESGAKVVLLTEFSMTYYCSEDVNLTLPVYSHFSEPAIPKTVFTVSVNGVPVEKVTIDNALVSEYHSDYEKFWPSLSSSGVGTQYLIKISMQKGVNLVTITRESDSDFEIYLGDISEINVDFDMSLINQ